MTLKKKGLLAGPLRFLGRPAYIGAMQTQNPLMDELAKITQAAMGIAQAAGDEAKTAFRAQGDKLGAEFDLVRRDELDALRAEIAALRAEVAKLAGGKAATPTAAAPKAAKPAARAKSPPAKRAPKAS